MTGAAREAVARQAQTIAEGLRAEAVEQIARGFSVANEISGEFFQRVGEGVGMLHAHVDAGARKPKCGERRGRAGEVCIEAEFGNTAHDVLIELVKTAEEFERAFDFEQHAIRFGNTHQRGELQRPCGDARERGAFAGAIARHELQVGRERAGG